MPGHPLKRDWLHCNSLDYNAELGQIVTNSVQGEFYVIDHDGTFVPGDPQAQHRAGGGPGRRFSLPLRRPGPLRPGRTAAASWRTGHGHLGPQADRRGHDVQWIKPGLPGAGHFLIFNNGQYLFDRTSQSSILEINGFLDANGRETGRLRQSARRRLRAGRVSPRHAQTAQTVSQAGRLELPVEEPPGILQPHRLRRPASAQRQHADLLR